MVAEVVMDHLARAVGKSSAAMRELNLYKEGDTTHFGQSLDGCQVGPGCPAACCCAAGSPAADSLHPSLRSSLHSRIQLIQAWKPSAPLWDCQAHALCLHTETGPSAPLRLQGKLQASCLTCTGSASNLLEA